MVLVKIMGGMGNQMFQYAYALKLKSLGYNVILDISIYKKYKPHRYELDNFEIYNFEKVDSIRKCIWTKLNLIARYRSLKILTKERNLNFNPSLLQPKEGSYISGYFQSEQYFQSISDLLHEHFKAKNELSSHFKYWSNIIQKTKNTCSIHIRRGDYMTKKNQNIHGILGLDYFLMAINRIQEKSRDTKFFMFSDDIQWVKKTFVGEQFVFPKTECNLEDLILMSACENNIIANSSFSWWGAWLNKNSEKLVISPRNWFKDTELQNQAFDIIPKEWVKL